MQNRLIGMGFDSKVSSGTFPRFLTDILDVYFTGLLRQKAEVSLGVEHELEMSYCDEAEPDNLLERVLVSGNFSLIRSEPRQ